MVRLVFWLMRGKYTSAPDSSLTWINSTVKGLWH